MRRAVLALADGTVFEGKSFGSPTEVVGEVVFNTSMFGYQEILTDPSYAGQIVTMAYPHMGNVGTNSEDEESDGPHAVGMAIREYSEPSNWRSTESLGDYLIRHKLAGIEGIDTRKLVRHLRINGSQMGVLSSEDTGAAALVDRAQRARGMEGLDLATALSTREPYVWSQGFGEAPAAKAQFKVIAYDYGLKRAMLRCLVDVGCSVKVVPSRYPAEEILREKPDGVFLTNGPGDPAAVVGAERNVAALLGKVPVFGICLGHQILALALGGKTYKMKFGHRGANQPVKDFATGKVEITAQNHGFAVDAESVRGKAEISHQNLNDLTVEGLRIPDARAFSVQYHPESSPGPHDARHLFHRFAKLMQR